MTTPVQRVLIRLAVLVPARVDCLIERVESGDEAAWGDLLATVGPLAALAKALDPSAGGRLLTTSEMAEAMAVSPKTVLRRRKTGQLQAVQLGRRGRGALRWRVEAGGS